MEELRSKHKSAIQNAAHQMALECIHPQASHGSSHHVHPYPSPVRLQHAFQTQNSPKMFHPKGLKPHIDPRSYGTPQGSPILGRALCLTPRGSPLPGRVSHLNEKFQDSLTLNSDTDVLVAKIGAMFPTVSETHIKILLKKYYNREAVVISALQVEKHPITTPGPLTMSPSAARLAKGSIGVYSALQLAKGYSGSLQGSSHFTPLSGTPHGLFYSQDFERLRKTVDEARTQRLSSVRASSTVFRPPQRYRLTIWLAGSPSLLRPSSCASSYYGTNKSIDGQQTRHHSPKMKLKYLKSIFPKAEETLILDVLANKDNNVQKASEELITMGFNKKEVAQKKEITPPPPKKIVSIVKTFEEKNQLREKLQGIYPKIAERVITIALESVDFNEERAEQILDKVAVEEETPKLKKDEVDAVKRTYQVDTKKGATSPSEYRVPSPLPLPRRIKSWAATLKPILKTSTRVENKYKSQYTAPKNGPNAALRHGPKDSLLLEDYLPWTGPDPELHSGQCVTPDGPGLRRPLREASAARGPSSLAKGPAGLAKGSMYKLNKKSAKM